MNAQKNLTLVAIDFKTHDMTRRALEICLEKVDPAEVIVVSDQDILPGTTWVEHEPTKTFTEYNLIMMKGIASVVDTSHALYVQYDGMIQNAELWRDEFLNYDYIGAVWPWEPEGRNVGNGGFSLRSKKLLDACCDPAIQLSAARNFIAEDATIAIDNRAYLENKYGINFAPSSVARQFSHELEPSHSWGWHGVWNIFNHLEMKDVDFYASHMTYKGWNVYLWHHVLAAMANRNLDDHLGNAVTHLYQNSPEHVAHLQQWFQSEGNSKMVNLLSK